MKRINYERNSKMMHRFRRLNRYDIINVMEAWKQYKEYYRKRYSTTFNNIRFNKVDWKYKTISISYNYSIGKKQFRAGSSCKIQDTFTLYKITERVLFKEKLTNYSGNTIKPYLLCEIIKGNVSLQAFKKNELIYIIKLLSEMLDYLDDPEVNEIEDVLMNYIN